MAETTNELPGFAKEFTSAEVEERCRTLWDEHKVYAFDPNGKGEIFSVDTPPPYVSASHLHVGHAMSYAQAEIVVRYQRMHGRRIFYPMGFDDNGLPTERYVEKNFKIDKRKITRSEFRELCLKVTTEGAAEYEKLWRALGLSVDWKLRYSTIDEHCRRTAQKSFIELFESGRIYRSEEPVLWDTSLETALAQADLETMERKSTLHDIAFTQPDGSDAVISTTRPELLCACVALYCNEKDERYAHLHGKTVKVPLFDYEVPVKTDADVDPAFGTGLMMVCTFGDGEDVHRWKRDKLELRVCLGRDGKMTELAGQFAGLTAELARKAIIEELKKTPHYKGGKALTQNVSVSERTGVPVEFVMAPQWFIRCLDMKDELMARAQELTWFPEWMKVRLEQWISGLRFDWNISRQRFYGVPLPVWFCGKCATPALAKPESLPVDPLENTCPHSACTKCGASEWQGDPDVMDTWMTSSLTPLLCSNWAGTPGRVTAPDVYPMSVRVQAFEIIRTWLFYTVIKSHLHTGSLPWKDVMISGWGLNENGKKISKRDLEQYTDANGYNRYEPYGVIKKFGADAVRYWAAGGHLGHDMRYNERDVQNGRRVAVKLWNVARFAALQILEGETLKAPPIVPLAERTPEDRWIVGRLGAVIEKAHGCFQSYDYAQAREAIDKFFWDFCDDYVEIVKDRFWRTDRYSPESRASARSSLWECIRGILALYAPFLPFVTEELYQILFRQHEGAVSIHVTPWPKAETGEVTQVREVTLLLGVLRAIRGLRSTKKIPQTRELAELIIDQDEAAQDVKDELSRMAVSIQASARVRQVSHGKAETATEVAGLRIGLVE